MSATRRSLTLLPRTAGADRVVKSICPYCGVGCGQLVTGAHRVQQVLCRRPFSTHWETLPLETAMDMVAARVQETRDVTWQDEDENQKMVRRTLGIAHLGGVTLDNEENYLLGAGTALTAASLLSFVLPGATRRRRRNAALLGAAGSLALRFALHYAGKASTKDPRASFEPQRRHADVAQASGVPTIPA